MTMVRVRIPKYSSEPTVYKGSLKNPVRPGWKLLLVRATTSPSTWIATLLLGTRNADHDSQEVFLAKPLRQPGFGLKFLVVHFNKNVADLTVRLHGHQSAPNTIGLAIFALPQTIAGVLACLQNVGAFSRALRVATGSYLKRVRKAMAAAATIGQPVPTCYALWTGLFDVWPTDRLVPLWAALEKPEAPAIEAFVLSVGPDESRPLAATLASLRTQAMPATCISLGWSVPTADYIAILQAGEVLPSHALLVLAAEAMRRGRPAILMADEDRIALDGSRSDPMFKPEPNLSLICSGTLSRGVWLIRRDLAAALDGNLWAECIRIAAWFRARALGLTDVPCRVPYVLTHRRADAEDAPAADLEQVVERCLEEASIPAVIKSRFPVSVRRLPGPFSSQKVSIVIPSKLTSDLTINCMAKVLSRTLHNKFELLIVVTQTAPLTEAQLSAKERLCADKRVRVEVLERPAFNYSLANNFAAARTTGEFICLLNDDVQPLESDWLDGMLSFFTDDAVGIVGAKLYYPNMTVQHGGMIVGLAGICEHANRYLPRGEPGYAWRGILDQDLSAVTGACMLVRRDVFEAVGGLDETYPSGFNDVDFCLRVREIGRTVVLANNVEMIHHETVTFGQHYTENSQQQEADVQRMRMRWGEQLRNDPFHNPNLSLVLGSEWRPAFPPRLDI
jgi:GT2 family glycosyltransferase